MTDMYYFRSCTDMMSVSDNIDRLYNKTHTSEVTSELSDILDDMNKWQADTDTILQQLQNSKVAAVKAVSDCRAQLEKFLKKLEQESIKEIEVEYKILESQILEGRKRFVDSIDDLKNLKQLIAQASTNKAQLFVCTNLAEKKCATLEFNEMKRKTFNHAEVKFVPSKLLKSSVKKIKHLGEASAISSRNDNLILYKATKICDMNVGLKEDRSQDNCEIWGSCIIDDTVIFTDYSNHKLKRYDILSSSLIDYCDVPYTPYGVCRAGDTHVAVACKYGVQFVSIHNKLSFSRSMYINHECYSIAYSNNRLYITDTDKSLYMYDMSGNILKTVTSDKSGQPLFQCSKHITFNDKKDRLFVCDEYKGLVCFNAQCDYVETITYHNISPTGVYIDGHGNVIVADNKSQIIQCEREGQKRGIIVNKTGGSPLSVCIHHGLKKMFVSFYSSNTVEVYNVFWEDD
ncbi:hypothetical protein ACF0H5_017701 [Mactra antiquata]